MASVRKVPVSSDVPLTDEQIQDKTFLDFFEKQDYAQAHKLLGSGQEINVADERGETPMHKVARHGDADEAGKIAAAKGVLDFRDRHGVSPLMISCHWGRSIPLCKMLVNGGADPAAVDLDGDTALHKACYYGKEEVIAYLLSLPAVKSCLECKNKLGRTPLAVAAWRGSGDIVTMLIEAGADHNSQDSTGRTPLQLAERVGKPGTTEALKKVEELFAAGIAVTRFGAKMKAAKAGA